MIGLVVASLALGACGGGDDGGSLAEPDAPSGATRDTTTTSAPATSTGSSFVAQATGSSVAVYDAAGDATPARTLDNPTENGAPLVFLVAAQQGDWINVHLPVRPNGSTGWVKASEVSLATNTFQIDIELSDHRLVVRDGDELVLDEPIGVGTADTPTPGGVYYLKELLQPPDPDGPYGPYAYGLSGFSNVLESFAGGDGVIGIHGTNDPDAIGTDVSHGCIRLRNEAILQLVPLLPLGTPVHISA